MRNRWLPVGVLAGVLFAVNVVARLLIRFAFDGNNDVSDRVTLGMFVVIGLILAVVAFRDGRREPVSRWLSRLSGAVLLALALTIFVGPLLVGRSPFADGAGVFFAQIWFYAAAAGVGVLVGYLVLVTLGKDHRSELLRRYAEVRQAKPRRVVRR